MDGQTKRAGFIRTPEGVLINNLRVTLQKLEKSEISNGWKYEVLCCR